MLLCRLFIQLVIHLHMKADQVGSNNILAANTIVFN